MPRSFLVKKATTNYGQQFVKLHNHHHHHNNHIGGRNTSIGGGDGQKQPPSSPTEGDCAPYTISVIGFNNKSVHRYSLSKSIFLFFFLFCFRFKKDYHLICAYFCV